ncbi:hypothetical protein GCM10014715_72500 [Streptomyces spiralis]|uniref:Uncharacterized protein n=1 Tax=Streptomyces spiralis TaxID=66376 RepID=A0A919AGF1_9ACTN|nr:hypothetical protein GCM10014715_72500 [Streptomyces spiralis]
MYMRVRPLQIRKHGEGPRIRARSWLARWLCGVNVFLRDGDTIYRTCHTNPWMARPWLQGRLLGQASARLALRLCEVEAFATDGLSPVRIEVEDTRDAPSAPQLSVGHLWTHPENGCTGTVHVYRST